MLQSSRIEVSHMGVFIARFFYVGSFTSSTAFVNRSNLRFLACALYESHDAPIEIKMGRKKHIQVHSPMGG